MNQLKLFFALLLATVAAAQAADTAATTVATATAAGAAPTPAATGNAGAADESSVKSSVNRFVAAMNPFDKTDESTESGAPASTATKGAPTDGPDGKKNASSLDAKMDNKTTTVNETETPGKIIMGSPLSNQSHLILLYGLFGAAIFLTIVNFIVTLSINSKNKSAFDGLKAGASLGR